MRIVKLAGKRCLVTGAASGIGRATALAAADKGARLVLTDLDAEGLERTASDAGDSVLHASAADVTDHGAVTELAAELHARHGTLDVVMNIAGVSTWGPVEALRREDWDRMIDVNLRGPVHVIEAFVGPMVTAGRGGHLVNVSSAAGLLGLPWHAAYSASKFGLRGVSEVLRFDLRRHGIGVTLVCPGAVDTPLVGTLQIVGVDREHPVMRRQTERFRRRAATPERVAGMILRGVERERYLVYTSAEVRFAHALQRVLPPAYELVMRRLNDELVRTVARAAP